VRVKTRESWPDQLSRVRMMASDNDTWDLSEHDMEALTAVLTRLDAINSTYLAWAKTPCVYPTQDMLDALDSLTDE
jgi:hypothetical protein